MVVTYDGGIKPGAELGLYTRLERYDPVSENGRRRLVALHSASTQDQQHKHVN